MKILVTHELYPPNLAGGGEHVVQHAAEGLQALGCDVKVLTTGDPSVREFQGVPTTRLPHGRYRLNLAVRRIAAEAAKADIIQTFTYHACLPSFFAGRCARKPVVMLCLGLFGDAWLQMRGPAVGRAWRAAERMLLTLPFDRVAFLSEFSMQAGLKQGVHPSRAFVANPGVECGEIVDVRSKSNSVLFVGKVHARKGIDVLLDVARALPQVPFEIVGWADEADRFRAGAPANVRFIEFPGGRNLWPYYRQAGIFFMPSRAETFGMAILQAMAAGCAVVSTVPLPYEGTLVAVDDRPAMIDAISRLWSEDARRRKAGSRNMEIAREFTWPRFCGKLLAVYEELLAGKRGQRKRIAC